MKIKTSELSGKALDWAVETLEIQRMRDEGEHVKEWWVEQKQSDPSPYSEDWLLCGPIIEREGMDVETTPMIAMEPYYDKWRAWKHTPDADAFVECGPTPLVAVLRAYVASKMGDEVDVPDCLVAGDAE